MIDAEKPATKPALSELRSSTEGHNVAIGKPDLTTSYDVRGFSGVIGSRQQDGLRVVHCIDAGFAE